MHTSSHLPPTMELLLSVIFFVSSASLAFFQNADLYLGIVAKLVAICAGGATVFMAYVNYKREHR